MVTTNRANVTAYARSARRLRVDQQHQRGSRRRRRPRHGVSLWRYDLATSTSSATVST